MCIPQVDSLERLGLDIDNSEMILLDVGVEVAKVLAYECSNN